MLHVDAPYSYDDGGKNATTSTMHAIHGQSQLPSHAKWLAGLGESHCHASLAAEVRKETRILHVFGMAWSRNDDLCSALSVGEKERAANQTAHCLLSYILPTRPNILA